MKTLITLLFFSTLGWSTATVTGNVTTLSNGTPTSVSVVFTLQNCRTTPRIVGTTLIASTVTKLPVDASGNVSGSIWRNDEITCVSLNDTFYTVSIVQLQGGLQQATKTMNIKATTPTLDLNSIANINSLTPAPFNPLNVITNPPAGQNVTQPAGTAATFVGDGFPLAVQGSTDVEHGFEIKDSSGGNKWRFAQQSTSGGQPSYSLLLKSVFGGIAENYLRCVHDGTSPGIGSCRWMSGLVDTDVATTFDFSTALQTNVIKAVASSPPTPCIAKTSMVIDQSGSGGQKLKICNAAGNGYDLIGDGSGTSAVTSFNARTGDILPVIGDYAALVETLQNKTIDSVNNTLITRSRVWFDAGGCNSTTASSSLNTPSSGTSGATASCVNGTTNADISFGIMAFPDAISTIATGSYRLSTDWSAASSIDLLIHWYQDISVANPSQVVKWNIAVTCINAGQSMDRAWNTASTTNSSTSAQFLLVQASTATLDATNCSANSILLFKIVRDGTHVNDTFTGTAKLTGAELTIVRSQ